MAASSLDIFKRTYEASVRTRADLEATRAIAALHLYQALKGEFPQSFNDVIATGILKARPFDPFGNRPLSYSREKGIVWSVGADEKNDGGAGDDEGRWEGKDAVWKFVE